MRRCLSLAVMLALAPVTAVIAQDAFAPFVIPAKIPDDSLLAMSGKPIAVDSGRIAIQDGHFVKPDGNRFRAWGVNLGYGANFPTKEDAPKVARRMAAFGINSVRIHHIDAYAFPSGIWQKDDPTKFSDEAVDRLDFFIDQLAKHGIYTNLNLHVSRTNSDVLGLPSAKVIHNYDKMVDLFTPQLIAAEKDYARRLLEHVNPYRNARYADDPAVAFIEINNENGIFLWGYESRLPKLPPFYKEILQAKYNAWLRNRYPSSDALRTAWGDSSDSKPLPPSLILSMAGKIGSAWDLQQSGGAKVKQSPASKGDGVRIDIASLGSANWNLQLNRPSLAVETDRIYTVRFNARADSPRNLSIRLTHGAPTYKELDTAESAPLTDQWQAFEFDFAPNASEPDARLSLAFGDSMIAWEIADVAIEVRPITGVAEGENLASGNIALVPRGESAARRQDRLRFMAELERDYYDDWYRYLRNDLRTNALITGSMVFGPLDLWAQSSKLDYVDSHAYWSHPSFPPGAGFNREKWSVTQRAMVDAPSESKLTRLAYNRLAGKPYTVSEYNHSAPNDFQAEAIPMVASFAAAQDWDGIWLFSYSQGRDAWDQGFFNDFFAIDHNPAKLGFMVAGATIFRDFGIAPLATGNSYPLAAAEPNDPFLGIIKQEMKHGIATEANAVALGAPSANELLKHRVAVKLTADAADTLMPTNASNTTLSWPPGRFKAIGDRAMAVVKTKQSTESSPFDPGELGLNVYTITSMDGRPLKESDRILFTAVARAENTDMVFSGDRRTVGKNWGKAPVRIETLKGVMAWPVTNNVTWTPLKADGTELKTIALRPNGDGLVQLPFDPANGTMWYILQKQ